MLRYDFSPVLRPIQNGELVERQSTCGSEVARDVHRVDEELAVLDADVDVRAEDEQLLREVLHVLLARRGSARAA